ncbi:putative toxin-antitoxin system toxin component, PIN family [Myxococcota bacterium]|nr:putative toxin-antitoxin system toxin component, PIN family [Myxococcota bacterium]
MRRVVLDTNVVVSALLFRGPTSHLHTLWKSGALTLVVSDLTLGELARVLAYPKFRLPAEMVTRLVATEVLPFSDCVVPEREPTACRDASDDEFLWSARDGCAEMLVTGDPDLLALRPAWSGVPIVTVAEALALLR